MHDHGRREKLEESVRHASELVISELDYDIAGSESQSKPGTTCNESEGRWNS